MRLRQLEVVGVGLHRFGRIDPLPIVLVGRAFWERVVDMHFLAEQGLVDADDVSLIDLRDRAERERHGEIPGSVHAPYTDLEENIGRHGVLRQLSDSGRKLVFYCAFGERSAMAVQASQEAGLGSACHIAGGIDAWKKAMGPLETPG